MYLDSLLRGGITRGNSAVFGIDFSEMRDNPQRFFFTVDLALYHAISLAVQGYLKESGLQFGEYYRHSPSDVPCLLFAEGDVVKNIAMQNGCTNNYLVSDNLGMESFPYGKISDFGVVPSDDIILTIEPELFELEGLDVDIQLNLIELSAQTRFFVKKGLEDVQLEDSIIQKILPDRIISPFIRNLRNILLRKLCMGV